MAQNVRTARKRAFVKPATRRMVRAEVLGAEQISPTFVRVTVGGSDVATVTPMGFDHWFRMFFTDGQRPLELPVTTDDRWWPEYQEIPEAVRPVLRNYTFRGFRAPGSGRFGSGAEIDIDFASHGDLGPASAWANRAAAGDEVGILDEGISHLETDGDTRIVLVADESALPAVAGILDSVVGADPLVSVEVFVEVPHEDDLVAQCLTTGENVRLHRVIRSDTEIVPGRVLLDTVRAAELPAAGCAFVAGESALATGVRRHLVRELGWDRATVTFSGYWKYGEPVY